MFDAVLMADGGVIQQGREETEQCCSVSEEKALSDSELKVPHFCLALIPKYTSYIPVKRKTLYKMCYIGLSALALLFQYFWRRLFL